MAKRKSSSAAVSTSEEKPPREYNFDLIGKGMFRWLNSAIRTLGVRGTLIRRLSTELRLNTIPLHLDVLIQFRPDPKTSKAGRRQRAGPRIGKSLVHVEVVERLQAKLVLRMIRYWAAILLKHGLDTHVLQYVLVVGPTSAKKRKRRLFAGFEANGRPRWIRVVYADRLPLGRLNDHERRGLFAGIFAIMNRRRRTRAAMERTVRRVRRVRNEVKQWDATTLLLAIKTTQRLPADQAKVLEEEVIEMATSERVYEQRAEEIVGWFDHAPWFRKAIERRQSPELRAALKKCRADTRARTLAETIDEQVDVIVQLLERRSIKLSRRLEAALRKKSPKQMISIAAVALTATSASEFARKARLNGRGNGRANGRANGRGNGRGNGKG